ncbi:MAG: DMT family transporter [Saprospiraceae bacterium]|nr:DMT family transporter [Saprospiraceae bacterium]
MNQLTKNKLIPWVILVSLAIVWGASFILIKRGLNFFTYLEVGALRITITFLFLLPFAIKRLKKIPKDKWKWLFISGFIGNVIPAFLFPIGQTVLDSYMSGILNSLTPLFTLIIGLLLFKQKAFWVNVLGVLIALFGAIGLINATSDGSSNINLLYASFILIATICYAINANLVKTFLQEMDSISITVFAFITAGPPVVIYLFFFTGFVNKLSSNPALWEGVGYIAILAIFGTALALFFFNRLIQITNAVFSSSVTYLIPVVAIIFGVLDGEIFKPFYLIWIVLILVGVLLVNLRYRKK